MRDDQFEQMVEDLNDTSMEDVCNAIGIEVVHKGGHAMCLCPFPEHNDTSLGSCFIIDDRYVFCHACHSSAKNINLVQKVTGKSFWEACELISDISGVPLPEQDDDNSNRKIMPFAQEKNARELQLTLLGLRKTVSAFCPEAWTDNPVEKKQYPANEYVEDGYLVGHYQKTTLQELFDNDETAFNYLVIGKVFDALIEMISDYEVTAYPTYEVQKQQEEYIAALMPLAQHYRGMAKSYGFNLDFISQFHKKPFSFGMA